MNLKHKLKLTKNEKILLEENDYDSNDYLRIKRVLKIKKNGAYIEFVNVKTNKTIKL